MNSQNPKFGINVFGHFDYGFGLAKAAKYFVESLRRAKFPHSLRNIPVDSKISEKSDYKDSIKPKYPVNLYFINPDTLKGIKRRLNPEDTLGKYEVGVWFWELEEFPEFFNSSFHDLDEVWVTTEFGYRSIHSAHPPKPVFKMPFPFPFPFQRRPLSKTSNHLFTFLTIFDYKSDFERKNPLGAVRAFRQAFPKNPKVRLIIKSTNAGLFPRQRDFLRKEAGEDRRIHFIEKSLGRKQFEELVDSSDAFVSLHRSEGYGLNIIDAISRMKPAIVTSYGGNMEFIPSDYPFLVEYTRAKVQAGLEFYKIDSHWAEPDIADASRKMKWVFENDAVALELAKNFRKKIFEMTSFMRTRIFLEGRLETLVAEGLIDQSLKKKKETKEEFDNLRRRIPLGKPASLLLFYTARTERILKLIDYLRKLNPSIRIDIFGRKDEILMNMADQYHLYEQEGFYDEKYVGSDVFFKRIYDQVLIPFLNYSGQGYDNIFRILRKTGIKKAVGIGIEGDLYEIQDEKSIVYQD